MNAETKTTAPMFKRTAEVTVVQLKIEKNKEYYVKFAGPIHLGASMPDRVDTKTGEITPVKPAHVAHVVDLVANAPRQIVMSSVMVSEMQRSYPNDGYVGRCFGFKDLGKLNGKQYNSIEIWEVEEPEGVITMRVAGGLGGGAPKETEAVAAVEAASAETKTEAKEPPKSDKKK